MAVFVSSLFEVFFSGGLASKQASKHASSSCASSLQNDILAAHMDPFRTPDTCIVVATGGGGAAPNPPALFFSSAAGRAP